jgi:hypothetical protein
MHPDIDEPISPELVLIDPELERRVRPFAVAGPDLSTIAHPGPTRPVQPPSPATRPLSPPEPLRPLHAGAHVERPSRAPTPPLSPPSARLERPPMRPLGRLGRRVGGSRAALHAAVALALVAGLGTAFLPPRDAPRLAAAPTPAHTPQLSARPMRTDDVPRPLLVWPRVRGAQYYIVEFLRKGRLIHAEAVEQSQLRAPAWLQAGRYEWRVSAGRGTPTARTTQPPFEHGWVIVEG